MSTPTPPAGNTGTGTNNSSNNDTSGSGNGNNNGSTGSSGNNNHRNNGNNRNNSTRRSIFSANERSWSGDKPEIGAVLGLRMETLDNKQSFRTFMEKMVEYVLREISNPNDVLELLTDQKDPRPALKANVPTGLSTEEKKNDVLVAIQTQRIKLYVSREMDLETNMLKIYGLIKGQCSHSLLAILKQEKEYDQKNSSQDVLWLMEKLKKLTAGLDNKSNKRCNLFDALYALVTMKQGDTESDVGYMKRFRVNIDTLVSAGGKHILCSPELAEAQDQNDIKDDERKKEESRFKAIIFLKRSDPGRYADFLLELQNNAHLENDMYPDSESDALDLMVRRSGAFNSALITNSTRNGSRNSNRNSRRGGRGFNFAQTGNNNNRGNRAPAGTVLIAGTDGRTCNVLCFNCNKWGHYSDHCPEAGNSEGSGRSGTGLMQVGYSMLQKNNGIPENWIILDSGSTDTVFRTCSFLNDIVACEDDEILNLTSNGGGAMGYYLKSTLKMFPIKTYYNEDSLANIISLHDLITAEGVTIKLDSEKDPGFSVTYQNQVFHFMPFATGLYYYDTNCAPQVITKDEGETKPKSNVTHYSLLQTVNDNKQYFTDAEIKGAEKARLQQEHIGWPSDTFYAYILKNNLLINSEVTIDDHNRALHIFGPAKPLLQGEMVRMKPTSNKIEKIPLPLPISQHHQHISISVDFFWVNGHTFLTTKSSKINFVTAKYHKSRGSKTIINTLNEIKRLYESRGFKVNNLHGDNEFNVNEIKNSQLPTLFHIYGKDEHVGLIERSNRTVKNKARTITHALPYGKIPKVMTIALVSTSVQWLNAFPSLSGVSKTMSPATIVEGKPQPNMKHKSIVFGSHAMVFLGSNNRLDARSVPAIALNPSNTHGGYYFMSLYSGKRIHSYHWAEVPIDDDVIERVEALAKDEEAPEMVRGYPTFIWKRRHVDGMEPDPTDEDDDVLPINEDEDNNNIESIQEAGDEHIADNNDDDQHLLVEEPENSDDEMLSFDSSNAEDIVGEHDDELAQITDDSDIQYDTSYDIGDVNDVNDNTLDDAIAMEEEEAVNNSNDMIGNDNQEEVVESTSDIEIMDEASGIDEELGAPQGEVLGAAQGEELGANSHGGRPQRECAGKGIERLEMSMDNNKEYASIKTKHYNFGMTEEEHPLYRNNKSFMNVAANYLFAQVTEHSQMSAKAGIKRFGDRAVAAMLSEYRQLNKGPMPGKPVFGCIDPRDLTLEDKKRALEAVNLIKKKKCGKFKGRTCANGKKQKKYLKHGESIASPTVSLEAIIGTLLIEVREGRDVAIFDVPGAYLHAEMPGDKKLLMVFRGEFVDIMCDVNEEYKKYVIYENGKKVLYVRILRAIYGCIESALLWYQLYAKTLKQMGFKLNPYDKCVANKMINGKQCTIAWYVDDNKISHEDPQVVTEMLGVLKSHFGDLVISRGNEHDLLGMRIKIDRESKNVVIDMRDQLKEAFDMFGEELEGRVATPANKNLFVSYDGSSPELDENRSEIFHSVVAKLLFIMKRGRPDIETAVSYLMTRVSKSNEMDWQKLKRCMNFIKETFNDLRTIGADNLHDVHVWVDASHAVHENMRGHTGGIISMGTGAVHCKSSKQKLNTRSTTESELVGVSEYLPYTLWKANFWKEQGYDIRNHIIYQDNESAIKMERNGRNSCTGNSRHVDIKYFWVKDCVDKKMVEIKYCPTALMLADYFTKALQGNVFRRFRSVIMGNTHINDLLLDPEFSLKERVEKLNIVIKNQSSNNKKGQRNVTYAEVLTKNIGDNKKAQMTASGKNK